MPTVVQRLLHFSAATAGSSAGSCAADAICITATEVNSAAIEMNSSR